MPPRPSPPPPPGPSALATRYVLGEPLSTGAGSTIYTAVDRRLGRAVAVTLFHRERARRRLVQVAATIAAIDHPHLAPIIDVGASADGQVFLVTPRGEGRTLAEIAAAEPMEWRRAVELVRQLLAAVGALHERGVVHGALSPASCLVRREGGRDHLRLWDVGRLIPRRRGGTSASIAAARRREHRTDLRAVGVILAALLASPGLQPVPRDIIQISDRARAEGSERFTSARAFALALVGGAISADTEERAGDPDPGSAAASRAAKASLAAWTRFEYALARVEARRAAALDPSWSPLFLLLHCLPDDDPDGP